MTSIHAVLIAISIYRMLGLCWAVCVCVSEGTLSHSCRGAQDKSDVSTSVRLRSPLFFSPRERALFRPADWCHPGPPAPASHILKLHTHTHTLSAGKRAETDTQPDHDLLPCLLVHTLWLSASVGSFKLRLKRSLRRFARLFLLVERHGKVEAHYRWVEAFKTTWFC